MLVVSAKKEYLMLFSGMTQVSMSGEFDNEGTSYQWFDEMFYLNISTVFYEMFQYLCDFLIHQTAIWLSDQKYIFDFELLAYCFHDCSNSFWQQNACHELQARNCQYFHWNNNSCPSSQIYSNLLRTCHPNLNKIAINKRWAFTKSLKFHFTTPTGTQHMLLNSCARELSSFKNINQNAQCFGRSKEFNSNSTVHNF